MNIDEIMRRPITSWMPGDVEAIAQAEIAESQTLEFKEDFSKGSEEKWRTRLDQISPASRDALAEEIVAFANSFGGILLLGVREKKQQDGRRLSNGLGKPIPRVAECADRLEASLRAVIDPPLPMLEVHPIPSTDDEGEGYIAISVPQSLAAPHGVGRPARAFVRRGASSEPMTMRDLQHVFWEARTAIDRVDRIFSRRHDEFIRAMEAPWKINKKPSAMFFQYTVVPARSFQIERVPLAFRHDGGFRFNQVPFQKQLVATFLTFAAPIWRPIAGGVRASDDDKQLTVWSDGALELCGFHRSRGEPDRHYPAWYAVGALWLLYNAMRLRRHLLRIDVPLLMEAAIFASRDGNLGFVESEHHRAVVAPTDPAITDRLELGRESEFNDVAQLFAEQIGWACGLEMDFSELRLGQPVT